MARRKVEKPTHIYWLIDIRPEIIAAGWGSGQPFYCGKTVKTPELRLAEHKVQARHRPNRAVSRRLTECNGYVYVRLMETVPSSADWAERERHWIKLLRFSFPAVNISDGGEGVPGNIHSPETRQKQSLAAANRTIEHRYKLGCAMRGKTHSEETRARLREANYQRQFSPEQQAEISRKISVALTGKKRTEEQRAAISLRQKGKMISEETREKLRIANKGRSLSAEARAKISSTLKGHTVTEETREKLRKAHTGRSPGAETREKLRRANAGKTLSAEHRAKISAAHRGKKMTDSQRAALRLANTGKKHSSRSRQNMALAQQARRDAERA